MPFDEFTVEQLAGDLLPADESSTHAETMRNERLIATGFLLFAALLKWTPWSSRLHLPYFVLAAPIIGRAFSSRNSHLRMIPLVTLKSS